MQGIEPTQKTGIELIQDLLKNGFISNLVASERLNREDSDSA